MFAYYYYFTNFPLKNKKLNTIYPKTYNELTDKISLRTYCKTSKILFKSLNAIEEIKFFCIKFEEIKLFQLKYSSKSSEMIQKHRLFSEKYFNKVSI